jgi:hypothetical protein
MHLAESRFASPSSAVRGELSALESVGSQIGRPLAGIMRLHSPDSASRNYNRTIKYIK